MIEQIPPEMIHMSALETLKSGQFSIQNKLHYRTTINKTNIFKISLALTITQYNLEVDLS